LDFGADLEAMDYNGLRILDQAVCCESVSLVQLFLKRGAKLGTNTWSLVMGNADMM